MKRHGILGLFLFVMFCGWQLAGREVEIAGSQLRLEVPDGYRSGRPANAPDILLQCDSADGQSSVQVVKGAANAPGAVAAAAYEQLMQQALPGLKQTASRQVKVNGRDSLLRSYSVRAQNMDVTVQAIFYADDKEGLIVHSIDRAGRDAVLLAIITSLRGPEAQAPAVAGVALLMAFGRRGVLGSYLSDAGLELAFTQAAVVLAQLFVAGPFYVKAAIAGFAKVEKDIEEAAAIDGHDLVMQVDAESLRRVVDPLAGLTVGSWQGRDREAAGREQFVGLDRSDVDCGTSFSPGEPASVELSRV